LQLLLVCDPSSYPDPYTTRFRSGPNSLRRAAPVLLRLKLNDELLVDRRSLHVLAFGERDDAGPEVFTITLEPRHGVQALGNISRDRKSTSLKSRHSSHSYLVFCL